ncbi:MULTISPECIES: dCTP deaminase [Helicobacter]|uniref:dCTP deaminase n=1 Tax=Helicobacter TaxID=209 RepID=UPI000EAFD5D4|nr:MULTISPECIES: dCTP deaminase [Helicobacter]
MGLKEDTWIARMSLQHQMITPFCEQQVSRGIISYGLSSYGYDIRVAEEFWLFQTEGVVDPKNFDARLVQKVRTSEFVLIPPNAFALAHSVEHIKMPKDALAICLGKSTYARCGIIVNVTPFEPEFEGHITIEISNTTPLPAKVYANEGIAQVIFLQADNICARSYKDKQGKYQHQSGITLPRMG